MADTLRLAFIGAGYVNFGGGEGPWDHASRLEQLGGVTVVAVCDTDQARARAQLERRRRGKHPDLYADCAVFADWEEMLEQAGPDAVFIGLTPAAHGRASGKAAVEVGCARRGAHMLIEKPLAAGDPEEVGRVADALRGAQAKDGGPLIVSVGYMLRYSNMVDHLRAAIEEAARDGRHARVFAGRYCSAYSHLMTRAFWDARTSGGPIIEQATHFVDLARYLLGEVELESVRAQVIEAGHPLGHLADMPRGADGRPLDADVPAEARIPRATAATWRFTSGALGSLLHGVLQQGKAYEAELEVWGDGLKAALADPYSADCRLVVREGEARCALTPVDGVNDPYLEEDRVFLQAIRERRPKIIRSPYDDALRTFELTCRITAASGR